MRFSCAGRQKASIFIRRSGYDHMWEYPITRAYADARVQRIYGGTNEIMKKVITRAMGLGAR
jgi:alkylation response protein AidB-like acyl-CoA dehydrogenase